MKPINQSYSDLILEVQNLSIGYGKTKLFQNLNFKAFRGEILFVMGSNGSGKSTLLKTLNRLIPPLSGSIIFKGKSLEKYKNIELAKQSSILLTDKPNLSSMNVREVISLGRFPYSTFWGSLKNKDEEIIEEIIELLNLQSLVKINYNTLSDGQKQKVLLGRTLVQDTPFIMLDEPTSFLDIPRKNEFSEALKIFANKKNKTIILSSHDWDLALNLSHSILFLGKNGLYKKGFTEDFYFNLDFKNFLEVENFKLPGDHTDHLDLRIGQTIIKLDFENSFERRLTIKALEKRKSQLKTTSKIITISKKTNGSFFVISNNEPKMKVKTLKDLINIFSES